jgi:hypothetical protein
VKYLLDSMVRADALSSSATRHSGGSWANFRSYHELDGEICARVTADILAAVLMTQKGGSVMSNEEFIESREAGESATKW